MAASSSSAKFFVHQNQNKGNSSSASRGFVADSDVVELNEFRLAENVAEKLKNTSLLNDNNSNNNAFDDNCRSRRSPAVHNLDPKQQQSLPIAPVSQQRQQTHRQVVDLNSGAETTAATYLVNEGVKSVKTEELDEEIDIEEAITKATEIVLIPTKNNGGGKGGSNNLIKATSGESVRPKFQRINSTRIINSSSSSSSSSHFNHTKVADEVIPQSAFHNLPATKTNNNWLNQNSNKSETGYRVATVNYSDANEKYLNNNNNNTNKSNTVIRGATNINNVHIANNIAAQTLSEQQQYIQQLRSERTPGQLFTHCSVPPSPPQPPPPNAMNSSQQTQAAPGNRITFTSQTLPNGTINIGGGHPAGSTIISTSQLPNTTTIKTITSSAAGGNHHGLPQQVQVQHHQVLQTAQSAQQQQQQHNAQSGNQPIINSMIPASVVVGMRPPNAQSQQKNVQSNTLGRVVIGQHMVGSRPQSPAITLSTLTPGQTPALILKTENGFQLLRVGTATSGPVTQTIGTNSTNPTQIRLQTVPAASSMVTTSSANNIVNSVSSTNSAPHAFTSQANITLQQQQSATSVATITGIQQQQQQLHQQQQIHQQIQHLHTQPQITQIQTIPPQQQQQQQQQGQMSGNTNANTNNNNNNIQNATTVTTTTQSAQGNTKEKCRKFLANLIDLSTREPKPVEKNVRNLIQELVNANVEPEEFCDRLERLLNASPQPCLIGFLRKSLPLLRQALFTKELVIEGIKPPPQHVVGLSTLTQQLPKIQAQIRPISQSQTTTIGQTQVRMISPSTAPRPIGHTTITKQQGSIRIQGPTNAPRLVNAQIRGPIPGTIQHQQQMHTNSHLQTVPTQANIVQIRTPTTATQINRPATVQIRAAKGKTNATTGTAITHVKVGQTQIKAISSPQTTSSQPPSLASISNNNPSLVSMSSSSSSSSILSTINSVATNSLHHTLSGNNGIPPHLPTPSLPTVQLPPHLATSSVNSTISNIDIKTDIKVEPMTRMTAITPAPGTPTLTANKTATKTASNSVSKASSKKRKEQQDKEKDDKPIVSSAAAAATSFFQQPSISMSSSMYGDDDINDVAAMGGVNLAEESQRILGCTENIGTQIRSCKDEVFLHLPALQARIRSAMVERGLEEPSQDVAVLISHACQERLKNIVEKLAVIAEHRIDVIKLDPRYEVTKDVRGQIKFLEELDKAEQKRHEELEREMLLRAAKSRSKIEDPEQAKMKARAKEMQRAEMEELRQRDANMTALQAIGPRKKLKLDGDVAVTGGSTSGVSGSIGSSGNAPAPLRPRIKRVNLRDMLFFMEQERETCKSQMLYQAYLK